jgi:SSS family solute:Na+ symporter
MNALDWIVLLGSMLGIAAYGTWRTRHTDHLDTYLKGSRTTGWFTIGVSVMATQASAITFLSIPGQGFESGIGFVQNYFGLPLALIWSAPIFLPIYRRLGVYTAYEYLGGGSTPRRACWARRSSCCSAGWPAGSPSTRRPSSSRRCSAGGSMYTIIGIGVARDRLHRDGRQRGGEPDAEVADGGDLRRDDHGAGRAAGEAAGGCAAGGGGAGQAGGGGFFVLSPDRRYTFWSGLLGGLFLSLSYFGTDQSQVQRYIGGASLREGRLGLVFNALLKIPMQFSILLLGALVFVFYQFEPAPVFFNQAEWRRHAEGPQGERFRVLEQRHTALHAQRQVAVRAWLDAREGGDAAVLASARTAMRAAQQQVDAVRAEAKAALVAADPRAKTKDSDYVFITFILTQLPHGVVGLLVAAMFAAALGSKAGELNALGTTSTIDLWRHFRPLAAHDEARNVRNAKWFTAFWGVFAIGFALFARFSENLIEAINILGSLFYGVVLGLFLVAFFARRVGGTAVFWGAIAAQALVFALYSTLKISYLWYNLIGCAACVILSLGLQLFLPTRMAEDAA